MSPQDLLLLSVIAFPLLVLTAAAKDLTSYTIPNWISLALMAAFVPAAAAAWSSGVSASELLLCLGVGAAALVAGIGMFALRWIGGGDAKLMAACALWMGVSGVTPFLMWTAIAGGVLTLSLITVRRHGAAFVGGGEGWVGRLMHPQGDVPYGIAICVGALASFQYGTVTQAVVLPF